MADATQADLDRLQKAYRSGVLKVRYANGEEVDYRSLADLGRVIAQVQQALAAAANAPKPVRRVKIFSTKDL
jgi:hypothetical protein